MHNHAERDSHLTIKWENVNPVERHNFEKVNTNMYQNFGTPYDFYSVMHYIPTAFSKNGRDLVATLLSQKKVFTEISSDNFIT